MSPSIERSDVERRAREFPDSWQRRLCVALFWVVSVSWWAFVAFIACLEWQYGVSFEQVGFVVLFVLLPLGLWVLNQLGRLSIAIFWAVSFPWWAIVALIAYSKWRGSFSFEQVGFIVLFVLPPLGLWALYRLGLWVVFGKCACFAYRCGDDRGKEERYGCSSAVSSTMTPVAPIIVQSSVATSRVSSFFDCDGVVDDLRQSVLDGEIENVAPKRQWPMVVWFVYGPAATAVLGSNAWFIWLPLGVLAFRDWIAKRTVERILARLNVQDYGRRIYVPVLLKFLWKHVLLLLGVCFVLALMGGLPNNLSADIIGTRIGASWATVLIPSLLVADVPFWILRKCRRLAKERRGITGSLSVSKES